MMKYPVSPEYCLIIKALRETNSLREASILLGTDPGHLSRKLQMISEEHDLIHKIANKWTLTETGFKLAQWVDESIVRQQTLLEEKTIYKISCFTWLGEELLIPGYNRLNEETHNKFSWRFNVVAGDLEQQLISGLADYVITCHAPNDPLIAHKIFSPDPWYIIVPISWEKELKKIRPENLIEFLHTKPFVSLTDLNPEQVLGFQPRTISDFLVNGVIGIRSAVINNLGWSCIPSFSLASCLKNKTVMKLPIESATKGHLSIWWLRSRKDSLSQIRPLSKWLKDISTLEHLSSM